MARHHDYINKVNNFIGSKLEKLRINEGMSRNKLAEAIGVTHQQLHKYEKGINRISVGRLALIAQAMNRPVEYFYHGLSEGE